MVVDLKADLSNQKEQYEQELSTVSCASFCPQTVTNIRRPSAGIQSGLCQAFLTSSS